MLRMFRKKPAGGMLDPDEIFADSLSARGSVFSSETKIERPIERIAYAFFLVLVGLGVLYLSARAAALQVKSGRDFYQKSQENRFLTRPSFPPRGIIYDRFKEPMVENYPSFGIVFEKEEFLRSGVDLGNLLGTLGEILKKPREYFYEAGFPENGDLARVPRRIVVAQGITPEDILSASSRLNSIAGIQIFENFRRKYKNSYAFAHLLGFVGKVSETDLLQNPELRHYETIGKNGVELAYDELIRGQGGKKIVEVDAAGKETRFKLVAEPQKGSDVILTIDSALQEKAYETIQHYVQGKKGGSAVAIDPRDGSVRMLLSYPGFDSNRVGYSISAKEFEVILRDPLKPLFNRAISGEFPSGSVIKPLFAAAALEEHLIDPDKQIHDIGYIEIPNPYNPGEASRFVDWKKGGHGWVDFYDAIAQSVNVYFYTIGGGFREQKGLGIERLKKYALAFGLGSKLGIDIPGERAGLFPDPEWKKNADKENPIWRIGDTYNVSIGQGGVKVTPLQMTAATAAIANGGKLYQPHIFHSELDEEQKEKNLISSRLIREGVASMESLEHVRKGMRLAVTGGTARLLAGLPVEVAAKTGTAEAGSGLPHAWVTVFAPADNPEIAVTVMVEHAGEGSTVAVPIMNEILQYYFANRSN